MIFTVSPFCKPLVLALPVRVIHQRLQLVAKESPYGLTVVHECVETAVQGGQLDQLVYFDSRR